MDLRDSYRNCSVMFKNLTTNEADTSTGELYIIYIYIYSRDSRHG